VIANPSHWGNFMIADTAGRVSLRVPTDALVLTPAGWLAAAPVPRPGSPRQATTRPRRRRSTRTSATPPGSTAFRTGSVRTGAVEVRAPRVNDRRVDPDTGARQWLSSETSAADAVAGA